MPSVGYADFLADTLPAWRRYLPRGADMVVVTTPQDLETHRVARRTPGVRVCATDVWREDGRRFNKGGALDLAFGFVPGWTAAPSERETCLALDADVFPLGAPLNRQALATGVLYGCPRLQCETPEALDAVIRGTTAVDTLPVIEQRRRGAEPNMGPFAKGWRSGRACLGYFQLFRYRRGLTFGPSRSAGGYDVAFRRHFASRRVVEDLVVLHLGALDRRNWRGRVVPPWRVA